MEIKIKYCNNIDDGSIIISKNKLNIKYGINGTGKTTISSAITNYINKENGGNLKELKPFKYYGNENIKPEVCGLEGINSLKVFNEDYINKYIFLEKELIRGSFDIFIRDENYQNGLDEIGRLTETVLKSFEKTENIDQLLNDFNEISTSFGNSQNNIHGSSRLHKALGSGNKVINIPAGLEDYSDFINHDENYKWIGWQINGNQFVENSPNCPYCTSNITDKKEKIYLIKKEYNAKSIEHLNNLVSVFKRLDIYFSERTKNIINDFITNIDGYTDDQKNFLLEIKIQIDNLNEKLNKIKTLSFQSLKDVDKVIELVKSYRIDLNLYSHLQSEKLKKIINIINDGLDGILEKAGNLQGEVNKQKKLLMSNIEENKTDINNFLSNAGYKYYVDIIEDDDGSYRLKLMHKDYAAEIEKSKEHLSFGEKNALALILFMYEAIKEDVDLIILDDPISSFDKNKKYAVIERLFGKGKSFRGRTVLLLTHDFDPILDMVYHHRDKFEIPKAFFLENNSGNLIEKEITKNDICTYPDILKDNITSVVEDINKLIYLRKLNEFNDNKGLVYQLLSQLFHKKDFPSYSSGICIRKYKTDDCDLRIGASEIESATKEIKKYVSNFEYESFLELVKDDLKMVELYNKSESNYEKLQIYRIINDGVEFNSVIKKFLNETYHIENDYIYQLNPCKYQTIPQYIIEECDNNLPIIEAVFC